MAQMKEMHTAEDGQVLVLTPILLLIGLLFVGLVTDVGNLYLTQYRMQAATDAAALASDQVLANTYGTNQAEVVATANRFMQLNGFPNVKYDLTNPSIKNSIQINPANYRVQLSFTQSVPTFFMSLFGMNHVNISVRSHAQDSSAFNYALFANQKLNLTSDSFSIQGSVHSNGDVNLSGNNGLIDGLIGYVGVAAFANNAGNDSFKQQLFRTSASPMPVFDQNKLIAEAKQANQYYASSQEFVGQNVTFAPNSVLYVDGDIYLDAKRYVGNCTLVATGNIYINEASNTATNNTATNNSETDSNGTNYTEINGILYAPNGTVSIQQKNFVINGSIVANQIFLDGNHIRMHYQAGEGAPGFQGMPALIN